MWILFIGLLLAFEAVADIFSQEWALNQAKTWLWLAAIGSYLIANVFWLYGLKHGSGLARGAVVFSVGSAIIAVVIGLGFYKEHLDNIQITGIVLGLASILLIFWPDLKANF